MRSQISYQSQPKTGILLGLLTLIVAAFSGCGSSPSARPQQPNKSLQSITLTPAASTVALGLTQSFTATGNYSDHTTQDLTQSVTWASMQSQVAVVSAAGVATAKQAGTATIMATSGAVSASAALTVAPATLTAIAVGPASPSIPKGGTQQLAAMGSYSDGSQHDITSSVTWASAQSSIVSISATGLATGAQTGSATVTATSGTLAASDSLTVTPPALVSISIAPPTPSLQKGSTQQLTATGAYTDGSTQDLTSSVTWTTNQATIAKVSATGLASALTPGVATIMATSGTISATDMLTVPTATLVSIAVTPASPSLPKGSSQQLTATGTYNDGTQGDITSTVTWSSAPPAVVTVTPAGLALAAQTGLATVTATLGSLMGTDSFTVTPPALLSIAISPANPTVPKGSPEQFSALGSYTDASTQDLTASVQWISSQTSVATVNTAGLASTLTQGSTVVTAVLGTLNATDMLTVSAPVVASIAIQPANPTMALGGVEQLMATGTLTDGTTQDVTSASNWGSSDPTIAVISPTGVATAEAIGSTTITATDGSVSASGTLSVKPLMAMDYFDGANSTLPDSTLRITNTGLTGQNLCAMVYVFDANQELSECCGCTVTPNGLRTLSVNKDLTANPLTGVQLTNGVVKVVAADIASNSTCNPGTITPLGAVTAWTTHVQPLPGSTYIMTEGTAQPALLSDADLAEAQSLCSFAMTLGSGQGTCTCGSGD